MGVQAEEGSGEQSLRASGSSPLANICGAMSLFLVCSHRTIRTKYKANWILERVSQKVLSSGIATASHPCCNVSLIRTPFVGFSPAQLLLQALKLGLMLPRDTVDVFIDSFITSARSSFTAGGEPCQSGERTPETGAAPERAQSAAARDRRGEAIARIEEEGA